MREWKYLVMKLSNLSVLAKLTVEGVEKPQPLTVRTKILPCMTPSLDLYSFIPFSGSLWGQLLVYETCVSLLRSLATCAYTFKHQLNLSSVLCQHHDSLHSSSIYTACATACIFPLFSFSVLALPFLPVSPLYCQRCPPPLGAPLGPGDFAFVCDSGVSGASGGGWGMRALSQAVRWKSFLNCLLSSFVPAVVPGNGLPGLHYNSLSRGTPSPKPWLCFITFFWLQCNLQSYSNTHTHRL